MLNKHEANNHSGFQARDWMLKRRSIILGIDFSLPVYLQVSDLATGNLDGRRLMPIYTNWGIQ